MSSPKDYLRTLLLHNNITVPANRNGVLDTFCDSDHNKSIIEQILQNQKKLMENWEIRNRVQDIQDKHLSIPNGTVGKPYQFTINLEHLQWTDIVILNITGLHEAGLQFDSDTNTLSGVPDSSGDHKFIIQYKLIQEEAETQHQKAVSLIINPDPKSLWKDLPGDVNDPYWKEDNSKSSGELGGKQIAVASKRGRSHANKGAFRDDAFRWLQHASGWSQVVVADGAGSAEYSRKGSEEACKAAINFFKKEIDPAALTSFDSLVAEQHHAANADTLKKINLWIYQNLGAAAFHIYKHLEECAAGMEVPLTQLHTTLIFTLFKKYDFGYAILSFGIGDCPIALINKEATEVTLMNWLDVGEYGGGTRFITMPEVFRSDKFATRFNFKLLSDFDYLVMMTDGIYDPKFEVEANLEKLTQWKAFFDDLDGNNPDGARVIFDRENQAIADELSQWMDFWSPGNHDDRTLAIIY